jgi:peptidoglycan hydrolase-like protein with peptidoglycan-binding domain
MKKYFLMLMCLLFISGFRSELHAQVSSGACSYHGGINMLAGSGPNGKVICNDGWVDSTVNYSDVRQGFSGCITQEQADLMGAAHSSETGGVSSNSGAMYQSLVCPPTSSIPVSSNVNSGASSVSPDVQSFVNNLNNLSKQSDQSYQEYVRNAAAELQAANQNSTQCPVGYTCSPASSPSPTNVSPVQQNNTAPQKIYYQINENLGYGDTDQNVGVLQALLYRKGYLQKSSMTNYFGNLTKSALQNLQVEFGITPTGYLGPKTLAVVNALLKQYQQ